MQPRFSTLLVSSAVFVVFSQAACTTVQLPFIKSVEQIAPEITVMIDSCASGSGVIIEKQGTTYSVLTARHVVDKDMDCLVITPDGQQHEAKAEQFQRYEKLDLAVVKFESANSYEVGKLANSEEATIGTVVYVAGMPAANETVSRSFRLTDGKITGRPPEATLGYTLVYDNTTKKGMSGGAVLDARGQIIGIHGRTDSTEGSKESYGIPIQSFLTANISQKDVENDPDTYISRGNELYDKGDYEGALLNYDRAIQLEPDFGGAYLNRGNARSDLGDNQGAFADFNQALKINPNDADAYIVRGLARQQLGDSQGALADFNQALKINPNDAKAYIGRGLARKQLGDKQGAIEDLKKAAKLYKQ